MTEGFLRWREYSQTVENFHVVSLSRKADQLDSVGLQR
jgi:hypothetical protein